MTKTKNNDEKLLSKGLNLTSSASNTSESDNITGQKRKSAPQMSEDEKKQIDKRIEENKKRTLYGMSPDERRKHLYELTKHRTHNDVYTIKAVEYAHECWNNIDAARALLSLRKNNEQNSYYVGKYYGPPPFRANKELTNMDRQAKRSRAVNTAVEAPNNSNLARRYYVPDKNGQRSFL